MRLNHDRCRVVGCACGGYPDDPRPPAQGPATAPGTPDPHTGRGTGVEGPHAHTEAASIERGRQIAMTAMDLAEARYRHEHDQPHRRDHCEDCARQAVAEAARPANYRDAAQRLRDEATTRAASAPDAVAYQRACGINDAAVLLDRLADDTGETTS